MSSRRTAAESAKNNTPRDEFKQSKIGEQPRDSDESVLGEPYELSACSAVTPFFYGRRHGERAPELRRPAPASHCQAGAVTLVQLAKHKSFEPAEDALPAFAVCLRGWDIAGESFLRDTNQSSGAGFFRAARMKGVERLRGQFPTDHGARRVVAPNPRVNEKAWRVHFKILAFNKEGFAIGANTVTSPLAAWTHVHGRLGDMVEAVLSPPARKLRRIADGLKYTSWGRSDEDFSDNSILVG